MSVSAQQNSTDNPLLDIVADMVRLALHDYRRGPGDRADWQRRTRYQTAKAFLEDSGLLDKLEQHDKQVPDRPA